MTPIGYVAIKFSIMRQKPTKAFQHWIDVMPAEYRTSILQEGSAPYPDVENDEFCLAQIKDYKSLIPASQAYMKPIFQLGQPEGIWGQNETAVEQCAHDFRRLARALTARTKVPTPRSIGSGEAEIVRGSMTAERLANDVF
jgi:chromosome partitioning protein